jgi:hypothetical protein
MQHLITETQRFLVRATSGAAGVLLLSIAACSDSTGPAAGASRLMFTTGMSASAALLNSVPVTNGGHTLDLTGVTLTISRAELKESKSVSCPGDDDENDDANDDHPTVVGSTEHCGELKIGPMTVDLPLTGSLTTIPANVIPAGTFREFELRVSQVELKGTFDGQAFDVTLPVRAKSEIEFATPLVVTADQPAEITVNVPVNTWLVNGNGSLVDPRTILSTPSVMALVKTRIAASLRAFEDHDHDGQDDHGGHGRD